MPEFLLYQNGSYLDLPYSIIGDTFKLVGVSDGKRSFRLGEATCTVGSSKTEESQLAEAVQDRMPSRDDTTLSNPIQKWNILLEILTELSSVEQFLVWMAVLPTRNKIHNCANFFKDF
uniref:Uncharacterized protein n=1 Tax=Physcomitrium patens TaxID=3218 RepID=A0A2K1KD33_PHYPA|nr:hypothetical protein PHYPA_010883 [Physcomitrium patens]